MNTSITISVDNAIADGARWSADEDSVTAIPIDNAIADSADGTADVDTVGAIVADRDMVQKGDTRPGSEVDTVGVMLFQHQMAAGKVGGLVVGPDAAPCILDGEVVHGHEVGIVQDHQRLVLRGMRVTQ